MYTHTRTHTETHTLNKYMVNHVVHSSVSVLDWNSSLIWNSDSVAVTRSSRLKAGFWLWDLKRKKKFFYWSFDEFGCMGEASFSTGAFDSKFGSMWTIQVNRGQMERLLLNAAHPQSINDVDNDHRWQMRISGDHEGLYQSINQATNLMAPSYYEIVLVMNGLGWMLFTPLMSVLMEGFFGSWLMLPVLGWWKRPKTLHHGRCQKAWLSFHDRVWTEAGVVGVANFCLTLANN